MTSSTIEKPCWTMGSMLVNTWPKTIWPFCARLKLLWGKQMSGPMTANCLLSVRVEEYQLEMRGACHSYTRLLVILLLQILLIEECATEAVTTQFHYLYSRYNCLLHFILLPYCLLVTFDSWYLLFIVSKYLGTVLLLLLCTFLVRWEPYAPMSLFYFLLFYI